MTTSGWIQVKILLFTSDSATGADGVSEAAGHRVRLLSLYRRPRAHCAMCP